jgi:gluconolactonase
MQDCAREAAMTLPGFRIVTTGLRFPEGPVAMPDGSVIVVEIEGGRLTRVRADGTRTTIAQLGGGPNGAAIGPDGKVYVCNNGGMKWHEDAETGLRPIGAPDIFTGGSIQRVDLETGKFETLYTHCGARRLIGPNDLVFDKTGGFYFTDLGKAYPDRVDRCALYYATTDGQTVKQVTGPTLTANGCALSPDGSVLYFVEAEPARLWAIDIVGPGVTRRTPWPSPHGARLVYAAGMPYQRYDSMAVDSAGNILIATLFRGGITVVSPDGATIRHLPIDDVWTTNLCFGGPDLRTCYVTLAQWGKLAAFEWERPGLRLNWQ